MNPRQGTPEVPLLRAVPEEPLRRSQKITEIATTVVIVVAAAAANGEGRLLRGVLVDCFGNPKNTQRGGPLIPHKLRPARVLEDATVAFVSSAECKNILNLKLEGRVEHQQYKKGFT